MKSIVIGMWAFWFAIAHHIARNNPDQHFYAYERDLHIVDTIGQTRNHPYFFPGVVLSRNVECVDNILDIIGDMDVIMVVIPIPFLSSFVNTIAAHIKPEAIFVNCSKGIDAMSLSTVSDILNERIRDIPYSYSVLSGGMIAQELIAGAPLAATIGVSDISSADTLRWLFESPELEITFSSEYKNIELYWALKNIFALYVGYLEGKWYGMSTVASYMIRLYSELPQLLVLLWGTADISFSDAALWGDLIATCFGKSRNRYFGSLVWQGISPEESVIILRSEKKHAEGYETLRGIAPIIQKNSVPVFQEVVQVFFPGNTIG